jgi:hypothetical protein
MMNCKGWERKWSWHNLIYYPVICIDNWENPWKTPVQVADVLADWKLVPHEYKSDIIWVNFLVSVSLLGHSVCTSGMASVVK